MKLEDYSFLFVITYGRSGSTLLMSLLNELDGVELRGENFNTLVHLYRAITAVEQTRKQMGASPASSVSPWYGADGVEFGEFAEDLLDSFVTRVLRPSDGVRVTGFKEIRYLPQDFDAEEFSDFVDFLLTRFPNSRVVFNTRNAEEVSRSGWFADMPTDQVKAWVAEADRRFQAAHAASDRCYLVDYSDMTNRTDRLSGLFSFLELESDAAAVEAVLSKPLTHLKNPWLRRLERARHAVRAFRSRFN